MIQERYALDETNKYVEELLETLGGCEADQTNRFVDYLDAKLRGAWNPYPCFFPLLFF